MRTARHEHRSDQARCNDAVIPPLSPGALSRLSLLPLDDSQDHAEHWSLNPLYSTSSAGETGRQACPTSFRPVVRKDQANVAVRRLLKRLPTAASFALPSAGVSHGHELPALPEPAVDCSVASPKGQSARDRQNPPREHLPD